MSKKSGSVVSSIRLSADEHAFLKKLSIRFDKPISAFLKLSVRIALGVPNKEEANIRRFQSIEKQLVGMARNLNQMARSANAGRLLWQSEERNEIGKLLCEVEELRDALREYQNQAAQRDFIGSVDAEVGA